MISADLLEIAIRKGNDDRWFAEIPVLPGCLAEGSSRFEAAAKVQALARNLVRESFSFLSLTDLLLWVASAPAGRVYCAAAI